MPEYRCCRISPVVSVELLARSIRAFTVCRSCRRDSQISSSTRFQCCSEVSTPVWNKLVLFFPIKICPFLKFQWLHLAVWQAPAFMCGFLTSVPYRQTLCATLLYTRKGTLTGCNHLQ